MKDTLTVLLVAFAVGVIAPSRWRMIAAVVPLAIAYFIAVEMPS